MHCAFLDVSGGATRIEGIISGIVRFILRMEMIRC